MTKRVYRRKAPTGTPLPSVIGGVGRGAWGRLKSVAFVRNRPFGKTKEKRVRAFGSDPLIYLLILVV
jgi:hypothetical protein